MTIEELKQRKRELHLSNSELSKLSGIPLGTVQKILSGTTESPRHNTIAALESVLKPRDEYSLSGGNSSYVCEAVPEYGLNNSMSTYPRQGEYTLKDYLALPDDKRVEMIDGVFYDMSSPTTIHQMIATKICNAIMNFIEKNGGNCIPFIAPTDVQLDCDDRTIVEPDVFITCDRSKIKRARLFGAPDFIVEVLSPSNRRHDMCLKRNKYENAGVREYWIVDPDRKKVIVYLFGEEPDTFVYGFDDKVPINIYDGDCMIDFADIYKYISFIE
ncbi:MAG: Uma2 family endonuclease [Lachnospiraceae bacterium]|nr:Uma2 family endonuclease [Lachnospiraceae bacterium]